MTRRAAANDNILIRADRNGYAVEEDSKLLRVVASIEQAIAVQRAFEEVNARFLRTYESVASNVRRLSVDHSRFLIDPWRT
jgi:hypothetical protein